MTNNETRKRLLDVLLACQAIGRFTQGMDFDAYERDDRTQAAVERKLGIIGEALGKAAAADPDLAARLPGLRQIVALRHRVIHGYDSVDHEIVWSVVEEKVPPLQSRVEALLAESGAES